MKISIAMATYNGAPYILEQLHSFVDQTLLPDELIITDDCSTDKTEEIVREFARTAPFKVIFHRNEKNLGYCGNFNAALMKTTGDLVFLSDQDDVWFPEKIETMVRLADDNPEMLVLMNDTELTDGELNSVGLTKLGQIRSAGLTLNSYVMGCCCAVRRELLDICMPIPEGFRAHDNWIVDFAQGLDAKLVNKTVLQYYRRHESNESQFIANRTVKVNRYDVFIGRLKKVFDRNVKAQDEMVIKQRQIFLDGVARAIDLGGEKKQALVAMRDVKARQLDAYRQRAKIRERAFVPRLYSVLSYLLEGGYKGGSGVKSLVRDLLG